MYNPVIINNTICMSFNDQCNDFSQLMAFSIPKYKVGINTSVSRVLTVSPPITVMAKGAPMAPTYSDWPIARGIIATIVVIDVIRMGRTLDKPAVIRARDFL